MVGSDVFTSKILPAASYRLHDQVLEPSPQVLDADHNLLGSAESCVTAKEYS